MHAISWVRRRRKARANNAVSPLALERPADGVEPCERYRAQFMDAAQALGHVTRRPQGQSAGERDDRGRACCEQGEPRA